MQRALQCQPGIAFVIIAAATAAAATGIVVVVVVVPKRTRTISDRGAAHANHKCSKV